MYYKLEDKIHVYHLTGDELNSFFGCYKEFVAVAGKFCIETNFDKYPLFPNEYMIIFNKDMLDEIKDYYDSIFNHELGHIKLGHSDMRSEIYKKYQNDPINFKKQIRKIHLKNEKEADAYSNNITGKMIETLEFLKDSTLKKWENSLGRYNCIRQINCRIKALQN